MSHATPASAVIRLSSLGTRTRTFLRRSSPALVGGGVLLIGIVYFMDLPGVGALLWMGAGTAVALMAWRNRGVGLPILPAVAVQHLVAYGLPILKRDEQIARYPAEALAQCGLELFLFACALSGAWWLTITRLRPSRPFAYTFKRTRTDSHAALVRIGQALVVGTTAYSVLSASHLIEVVIEALPMGMFSILSALVKAGSLIGYFLVSYSAASNPGALSLRLLLWSTFAVNAIIVTTSLLLSSATTLILAVAIGVFLGSGRFPWRFTGVTALLLAILHPGKFEMRKRYWDPETGASRTIELASLPRFYSEWYNQSRHALFDPAPASAPEEPESAFGRINNLQNLFFAIDAIEYRQIPVLRGATYELIPPLLIPRVFWPDKPRAHAGQIMLNVHFERQTLDEALQTYIAWGLVPEAFGNFGAIWGSLILGAVGGVAFAWIEYRSAAKPLLSLEGLLAFALFAGIISSFEMVASVLITSLFQSLAIITLACLPLVHRSRIEPRISSDGAPHA